MNIQLIDNQLNQIDRRSIRYPFTEEECIRTYKELLKIKEYFMMSSYLEVDIETLEYVRFRIMENINLYKRYIKESKKIGYEKEMQQLNLLYEGGIA